MNKLIILLLLLLTLTSAAQAACYQIDDSGRKWVTSDGAKNTTVTSIKQCVGVFYKPTLSVNNPLYQAQEKILFDPTFGGVRLSVNALPDQEEPCLFIRPLLSNTTISLQMYDATRIAADGTKRCNP